MMAVKSADILAIGIVTGINNRKELEETGANVVFDKLSETADCLTSENGNHAVPT